MDIPHPSLMQYTMEVGTWRSTRTHLHHSGVNWQLPTSLGDRDNIFIRRSSFTLPLPPMQYNTNVHTNADTFTLALPTPIQTLTLTPINSLRRPHSSPRSPLTSIHNIVAAWKECTLTSTAKHNHNRSTRDQLHPRRQPPPLVVERGYSVWEDEWRGGDWDWEVQWWVEEEGKVERAR